MRGELIRRYRSDAWDAGNAMTMFHEAVYVCGHCGGSGQVEDEESDFDRLIECPECDGTGQVVYYE